MKRLAILIACWCAGAAVLAVLAGGVSLFGKALEPAHVPRDTVQGTVVDRDSGVPLSDVSLVCISGYPLSFFEYRDEVKSDAEGRFTLPILHKDYHVEVRKHGYVPKTISWLPPDERHSRMRVIRLTRANRRAGG